MNFSRIPGQARAKKVLGRFLETERIPCGMLFSGPDGAGKTLMAREFAKALVCAEKGCGLCPECLSIDKGIHPDVKNVDALYQATLRGEEEAKQKTWRAQTIRHLRRDMELQSLLGSWKVAIITDAHVMEVEAANALLKILEEPPEKTLWILTSGRKETLLKTIQSRCFSVVFAPAPGGKTEEPSPLTLEALSKDPLAAMTLADSLPKELYLARVQVQEALSGLAEELRLAHMDGDREFSRVERPLRKLLELRRALASNADPRLVLTLAGEAAKAE